MFEQLCEPHHLFIIILVLVAALIALGGGKSLGGVLGPLFKKVLGRGEVNINLGGDMGKNEANKPPSCAFVDPKKCPSHQAEHERSIKNESNIDKIFDCLSDLKKEVREGNERILLALVAGGQIKIGDIPPRQ